MIPAGYMAKRVVVLPEWLPADRVSSIYSVSGCISQNFAADGAARPVRNATGSAAVGERR
jgi:hypothetical protein